MLNSGEIIYFIGTVVVMYIRETHKQRHYKEHTQEIRWSAIRIVLDLKLIRFWLPDAFFHEDQDISVYSCCFLGYFNCLLRYFVVWHCIQMV